MDMPTAMFFDHRCFSWSPSSGPLHVVHAKRGYVLTRGPVGERLMKHPTDAIELLATCLSVTGSLDAACPSFFFVQSPTAGVASAHQGRQQSVRRMIGNQTPKMKMLGRRAPLGGSNVAPFWVQTGTTS